MRKSLAVAAALTAVAPTSIALQASAHEGATGIVETRMHAMKKMGKATRSLKDMMADKDSYSADDVRKQAKIIKLHAGRKLTKQFPEGSLQEPTHAKPEIWTDWDRFSQLANQLENLASGLELAADNGLMMEGRGSMMNGKAHMSGRMGSSTPDPNVLGQMPADGVYSMLVETCAACHSAFRARKP
ncbi:cytochrome c [uncultured Cohaesibacter sp.]|uniref:c-type cytochrome n=1 Tax=uncultured Cohaesibacter sp. TaxID=1002546 RepID=UPI0029C8FDA5|nr:cytochrome c [uncultured Cohaesibacter sp.]